MNDPVKILIIEDVPSDAELMQRELRRAGLRFTAILTDNRDGFVEQLANNRPDIILSDNQLPSFDAMSALEIVREQAPGTPFIIVSGSIGEELAVQALKRGASDYILKDRLTKLGSAVERALQEADERKQLEQAHANIRNLAKFPEENPYPVLRISADGILLYANPGSKLLMEFLGLRPGAPVPENYGKHIRQALADGQKIEIEVACGQTVYLLTLSPVNESQYVNVDGRDITERKQADEDLRQSEERYRMLFEQARDAIMQLELPPDGFPIIRDMNTAAQRLFGYSHDELVGQPISMLAAEDDFASLAKERNLLVQGAGGGFFEVRHRRKDGSVFDAESSVMEMTIGGKRMGLAIERDITERKHAEDALRESERRYRDIFNNSVEGIYKTTLDGRYLVVNPSFARMFGYDSPEEVMAAVGNVGGQQYVNPVERKRLVAQMKGSEGSVRAFETQLKRKDGSQIWVSISARIVQDSQGNDAFIEGACRDISGRKQAEEALRASDVQLNNAMDIAHLGHWEYDVIKDTFTFGDHFYKIFRTTAEKAGGYTMRSAEYARRFVHPDDAAMVGEEVRKAIETSDPHFSSQLEHRIIYSDGEVGYITVKFFIVKDAQNRTIKTYGVNQDITERKRTEESLRESQAKYQAIFEATGTATMIVEEDTTIVMANNECLPVTGYSPSELIGTKWPTYVAPESMELMKKFHALRCAEPGKAPNQYEVSLVSKKGELRFAMLDVGMIPNTKQSVVSMLDITERKRAEEALRNLTSRQEALLAAIPEIIVEVDTNKVYTWANRTGLQFFGDDVIGHEAAHYFEGEQSTYQDVKPLFNGTEDLIYVESLQRRKDGQKRLLAWWCRALRNERGEVTGALSSAQDITAHRQNEQQITLLAYALESINDCVTVSGLDDRISYVNDAFLKTYGYGRDEVVGKTADLVRSPGSVPVLGDIVRDTLSGGWHGEVVNRRKDGSEFPVMLSTAPVRDKTGALIGLMGISRDITERKLAEQNLQSVHEQLQTNYAKLEMANEGLAASEEELKAADEELRQQMAELDKSREELRASEMRYRRLFESAKDGILILDAATGVIEDANPFIKELLVYPREELLGKELWQIGLFKDIVASKENFIQLQEKGYVRYEDLPLQTKDGRKKNVEFVSNVYAVGKRNVVQCNIRDITERKQGEEALRASEDRLRSFVDNTFIGIYRTTPDGRILMSNPALVTMLGYDSFDDLARRNLEQEGYEPGYERDEFKRLMEQADQVIGHETPWKRKDGSVIWVRENARCVRDPGGAIRYYEGTVEDITERKQATDTLALNYETQAAMNGMLGLSLEGKSIKDFLSRTLDLILSLKWLAVEAKGAIFLADNAGETLRLHVHKGMSDDLCNICSTVPFGRCICGRAAAARTVQFADRVDERHDIRYEGMPPHGHYCIPIMSDDRLLGVINLYVKEGHIQSLWEMDFLKAVANTLAGAIVRKRTEEELRVSKVKYQELVENLTDTIYSIDTSGVITYISPAVKSVTGYDAAEITGQPFAGFVDPGQRQYFLEEFAKTTGGSHEAKEYAITVKDGSTKWIRASSRPVYEGATLVGVQGIMTDITTQKRMEQERKIIEQQLQQSQKMEAIGQLAGGVAHDFNNMLAGIMGNAELLYKKLAASPEHMELVERILKAGEHAANLTKQLLSFARKGQYQMVAVDIHRAIGSVAGILANTIDRRIKIKQSLRAQSATVFGDPTQIANALMNLALNARDAMPEGGELTFATDVVGFDVNYVEHHQYQMEPGQYIMISVTDTGTGIPEEVRKHIFEPFFTTKQPGKGTGLGLASVYGIAKNHKGSIEVYSNPGHGTVMKMYLPLTDVPREQSRPPLAALVQSGTGSLLLVDDEPMIREMAGQMLKGLGYSVAVCSDGREAVDYYREHHAQIDLVILDMIMPRLNGREAFLQMRQINPGVRALLASGFSADGEAQEVLKLGIRGFIQKPFRMAEFSTRILEALGHPAAT